MTGCTVAAASLANWVAALPWARITAELAEQGHATTGGPLLSAAECRALAALYAEEGGRFRSRIVMARHGFGSGEYQYFAYPLPEAVAALREAVYPRLVPVANRWLEALGQGHGRATFPPTLKAFLARCHAAGQTRPTPLLLRYGVGDHNCLHQDLYGPLAFPLQLVLLLDEPGADFTGGELVLVEQRPRRQSRAEVVPLRRGEGVIFAVARRPARGERGPCRVALRHGVSRVRTGLRRTLGIIFHDAA